MFLNKSFNEKLCFLNFRLQTWNFTTNHGETCNARQASSRQHWQKLAETAQCSQQNMIDLCVLFSFYEFYGDKNKPGKKKDEIFNNGLKKNGKKSSSRLISMITLKRSYEGFWCLNDPRFSKASSFEIDTIDLTKCQIICPVWPNNPTAPAS